MTQRAIRGRGITSIIIHVVINFIAFDAYNIFFIKNTFKLELHINPIPAGGLGFICPPLVLVSYMLDGLFQNLDAP